jgi:rare lipoprotein A
MRWQGAATSGGRIARIGALILGGLVLASCSADSARNSYSPKVVEDGEPVPKGGGNYKVGRAYNINGRTYVPEENPNYKVEGVASWYGPDFHGRLTANREVYDMHGISAAHTTLPMPSYARVTNLDNGRSIVVRINDRGPYSRNRVIDLSIGTAKALAFYHRGLARVRVEYLGRAPLEGSDDRMLLATLRHGSPAPAPSQVMVASAKPFIPSSGDGGSRDTGTRTAAAAAPSPKEQTFSLSSASSRPVAAPAGDVTTAASNKPKPAARPGAKQAPPPAAAPTTVASEASVAAPPAPAAGFAPTQGGALGLMSGRGLY